MSPLGPWDWIRRTAADYDRVYRVEIDHEIGLHHLLEAESLEVKESGG